MNVRSKLEHRPSSSNYQHEWFSERLNIAIGKESSRSFARRTGLSETVMRKYLSGESTPNVERLVSIASAAGVSVGWLTAGEGATLPADQAASGVSEPAGRYERTTDGQKEWDRQAVKFKKGLELMVEMSKNDPNANPAAVWSALIMELITLHGLEPSGAERIYQTLQLLNERNKNR